MTCEATRHAARLRKQKSRERRKQFDMKTIELSLSATQRETLARVCALRGGVEGPYSVQEYFTALLAADAARLDDQLRDLAPCAFCQRALPKGCEGMFKGQRECFHFSRFRELMV